MDENENVKSTHLVVCVHGLWGNPGHLQYLVDQLIKKHGNSINISSYTFDGIDICGDRLVEEIKEKIKSLKEDGIKITKFSIIGYSLGGLFSRYAIGILYKQGIFDEIQPWLFTTFATPHLGTISNVQRTIPKFINWASPRILSKTGEQFAWIDKYDGNTPILSVMSDPDRMFFKALKLFQYRKIYANILNDNTVPYWTAAIEEIDPFEEFDQLSLLKNEKCDVIIDKISLKEDEKNTIFKKAKDTLKYLLVALVAPIVVPIWLITVVGSVYVQAMISQRRVQKITQNRIKYDVNEEQTQFLPNIASNIEQENIEAMANMLSSEKSVTSESSSSGSTSAGAYNSINTLIYEHNFPKVPSIDEQREACKNLNKLPLQKYAVYMNGFNSHAEIVVRNKFYNFMNGKNGKKLIKHFVEESFVV
ncbi:7167_t:CDS:2 [Ambispora leptoticha]|uniref:7167_t:CDS:1 n=1 Tax=Ambispora leptoticha TaxID=144679 RepID=A0A9N9BSV0_9GLOM|nr:7167_t:CDS:2 [Ambispora leptoticha]